MCPCIHFIVHHPAEAYFLPKLLVTRFVVVFDRAWLAGTVCSVHKSSFTFIDLFAGVGGFRLALESLGGVCVGFSEINRAALVTYQANFDIGDEVVLGDVAKAKSFPTADFVVGGVPCQSWSSAGANGGFADPRGRLWLDSIRVVSTVRPKAFLFENVKGLADPRHRDSLNFLVAQFRDIGYVVAFQVLNSVEFGVPQNRERIFLVGIRNDVLRAPYRFPARQKFLPQLASILDGRVKTIFPRVANIFNSSFELSADANNGKFFILSDIRGGSNVVHSWDLQRLSKRLCLICDTLLRHRRRSAHGVLDGNPLSFKALASLVAKLRVSELETLVRKGILVKKSGKYDFRNSKISAGLNGVYRVYLPCSHYYPTLTKTGSRDFLSPVDVPAGTKDVVKFFVDNIYKPQRFRKISLAEAKRLQGFPAKFKFPVSDDVAFGLLGNAVTVPVVKQVFAQILAAVS